nr:hypothetical protein [bacterium]
MKWARCMCAGLALNICLLLGACQSSDIIMMEDGQPLPEDAVLYMSFVELVSFTSFDDVVSRVMSREENFIAVVDVIGRPQTVAAPYQWASPSEQKANEGKLTYRLYTDMKARVRRVVAGNVAKGYEFTWRQCGRKDDPDDSPVGFNYEPKAKYKKQYLIFAWVDPDVPDRYCASGFAEGWYEINGKYVKTYSPIGEFTRGNDGRLLEDMVADIQAACAKGQS